MQFMKLTRNLTVKYDINRWWNSGEVACIWRRSCRGRLH